jgi:hypothetical protein
VSVASAAQLRHELRWRHLARAFKNVVRAGPQRTFNLLDGGGHLTEVTLEDGGDICCAETPS